MIDLHVVMMNRWGSDENHSYIIGVFDDREKAVEVGEKECLYRGGKYQYDIKAFSLNDVVNESGYTEEDELMDSINAVWEKKKNE